MEATLEGKIGVSEAATSDVFEKGKYETGQFTVKASKDKKVKSSLPVDVFVVTPTAKGTYPVLLFCPGWKMKNDWYSDMFRHIASHGYILVAPQLYGFFLEISISEEIERGIAVTEWVSRELSTALEENNYSNVYPDVEDNLVVSGHSRGGKTAFALALGETGDQTHKKNKKKKTSAWTVRDPPPQKFKAVIGIDPVGGLSPSIRSAPRILQYIPRCFNMSIPVAVVGAGYSDQPKGIVPPCAPDGVNHSEFFNESKPPVCYFLATEYGHFDMMDDHVLLLDIVRTFIAKSCEGSREPMRRAVGGAVVAFLRAYLGGHQKDLDAIVDDPAVAPITLHPVLHVKK
ncbi:hypothetical protein C2S51_006120 [Perilla frutescens var. frutescens]|nr:hypothetical protein C2S51_006120 [Perilla frutescens var. frutescens]